MKILYLSAHSILEYDEVKLLHDLGHEVWSPGAFICPENPGDHSLRPAIPGMKMNQDWNTKWHELAGTMPGVDPKYKLSKEFVSEFDLVIVMHIPDWIINNWEAFDGTRVIWRTIGQSIESTEAQLKPYREKGLQIVRYSPMEENIPGYIGSDALIRFYKDPDDYKDWTGETRQVITFAQSMKQRDVACNFTLFELVTRPFPRKLYGPGNEGSCSGAMDRVSHEEQKEILRKSRCYFATGTHPASYTLNFMEAWMTGIPVIAIGPRHGNAKYFPGHNLYEVDKLIKNGVNGFVSDTPVELQQYIRILLDNPDLAKRIGDAGRQEAIRHFGKSMITASWKEFLGE